MKEFNLYFPPSIADEFQRHYYDIVAKYCELFPSVPELLTELQRQAIVLAIITNGTTTTQMKKIRKMELTKWFQSKYIFISDECSSAKPEKRIFEVVKKEIGKNRLLYIGDSWEQDVVGAIEAGWDAIYFNTRLKTPSTSHTPLTSCISMKQLHDFLNQNL
ncbi:MAG: HAD-IA family hydrolase [Bacillaceae bacterium]|nr:HAD-IA family hydrolase [Bacillaceae bacterium]